MDLLLHPPDDAAGHRPDAHGRLSTVGHAEAFRAFAGVARRAGIRFMVIGGTFRDIAVRASSTRDIDIVLVDAPALPEPAMRAAGFTPVPRSPHAWRYTAAQGRTVDLEVAALASSTQVGGPFSVAFKHAERRTIEGVGVAVPQIEDYVILKLLAAKADRRRRARDLADVQDALVAFPDARRTRLSVAAVRARLRDLYGVTGQELKELVAAFRQVRHTLDQP